MEVLAMIHIRYDCQVKKVFLVAPDFERPVYVATLEAVDALSIGQALIDAGTIIRDRIIAEHMARIAQKLTPDPVEGNPLVRP